MSESTCIVELRESRTSTLKRIPLNRLNRAKIDPDGVKKFLAQQFYQARGPDVLSEKDGTSKVVGQDDFQEDQIYFWDTKKNLWEDQSLIQTALYCCTALYERAPHKYLVRSENKKNHDVVDVKFVGNYHPSPKAEDYTRFLIAEDSERNMFIAFRGSTTSEDWKENVNIALSTDIDSIALAGSFHGGFLNKVNNVNFDNLIQMINLVQPKAIITTGHSQGGAVSSLMYLKLLERCSNETEQVLQGLRRSPPFSELHQLLNFTFATPMIGNHIAESSTKENGYEHRMFHYINSADVVPAVLSIGHVFKTLETDTNPLIRGVKSIVDWANENKATLKIIETCVSALVTSLLDEEKWKEFSKFKKSYEQLKTGIQKNSTLFNNYSDFQYVPIGNYIFMQKQQNGRHEFRKLENHDSKLVERILQSVLDQKEIDLDEHKIDTYKRMLCVTLEGFKHFENDRKVKLFNAYTMKLDGFLRDEGRLVADDATTQHCSLSKCTINKETPLPLQTDEELKPTIGLCITCKDNGELECFFHNKCALVHEEENGHKLDYFDLTLLDKEKRNEQLAKQLDFTICVYSDQQVNFLTDLTNVSRGLYNGVRAVKTLVEYSINYNPLPSNDLAESTIKAMEEVNNSFGADTIGVGITIGVELASFGFETFGHIQELYRGKITWKQFWMKEVRALARGVLSGGFAVIGSKIGAFLGASLGSAIPVVGNLIGGIIGYSIGWSVGKFIGAKLATLILGAEFKDEIDQKANFFVQAMLLLDTMDILELNEQHVNQCFRRKALPHHPDKWSPHLTEKEKKEELAIWVAIQEARTVLLVYCADKTAMSPFVKERVQELFRQANGLKNKKTDLALAKKFSKEVNLKVQPSAGDLEFQN